MLRTFTATITAYFLVATSSLLAQTPAPGGAGGAPGAGGGVGAGGATGSEGALADWWWVILLVVIAIGLAIWYFTSRKTRV